MRATFSLNNADDMEASLTVTMTVREWKNLKAQLPERTWPATRLSSAIFTVINEAERRFYASGEDALP